MDTPLSRSGVPPSERRAHPRFAVAADADLLLVEHGLTLRGQILDLSLEGCRILTDKPLPDAMRARVEVTFRINGMPFRLGGNIQRSNGCELGLRFAGLSPHRQQEWVEVVTEVAGTLRRRAQGKPV